MQKCKNNAVAEKKNYYDEVHTLVHLAHKAKGQLSGPVPPRDEDQNLGASLWATLSLGILIF